MTKETLSGVSSSRILINLQDECDYSIISRGRKRTSSFPREVGLGTISPALGVQPSVALETFLEEVKLELESIEFDKPKDNISTGERQALKELSRNKSIILKKSDKGNTTVLMSRQDKLNEGQVLLNDSNNYRPLDKTMVETTTKKAQQLIKTLLSEGHIHKTAALPNTPDPPQIPMFYTLTKIHKPTPVGRPIISGCSGPTERISAFVDHLIQPIAQLEASYLKDTTDLESSRGLNYHTCFNGRHKPHIHKHTTTRGYYHCMPCIRRISPRKPSSSCKVFKRNA